KNILVSCEFIRRSFAVIVGTSLLFSAKVTFAQDSVQQLDRVLSATHLHPGIRQQIGRDIVIKDESEHHQEFMNRFKLPAEDQEKFLQEFDQFYTNLQEHVERSHSVSEIGKSLTKGGIALAGAAATATGIGTPIGVAVAAFAAEEATSRAFESLFKQSDELSRTLLIDALDRYREKTSARALKELSGLTPEQTFEM